jgi:4-hydroxyphenylacetate 3-monooxygenase
MVQTDQFPHVRDAIGEITTYIELTKAAIVASETEAQPNEDGILFPNVRPLFAIRNSGNRWYPRVRELLQLIFAGSLLYTPARADAFASPIREDIDKYMRAAEASAEERAKLFKVAYDLAVSSFGGRHELYERFYAGDPMFLRINTQYLLYDFSEPLKLLDDLLTSYSLQDALNQLRGGVR